MHFARLYLFKVIIPEMKPMKYIEDCFKSTEAKMTFEDVDKKDCCCQREDESTKAMLMSWKSQGTTKVMSTMKAEAAKVLSRVTSTRSDWRIWDPGRSEGRA